MDDDDEDKFYGGSDGIIDLETAKLMSGGGGGGKRKRKNTSNKNVRRKPKNKNDSSDIDNYDDIDDELPPPPPQLPEQQPSSLTLPNNPSSVSPVLQFTQDFGLQIARRRWHDDPCALVRHHLRSFDDFFSRRIYDLFASLPPVHVTPQLRLQVGGLSHRAFRIGLPQSKQENNIITYPSDARQKAFTYEMPIYIDIDVIATYNANDAGIRERFGVGVGGGGGTGDDGGASSLPAGVVHDAATNTLSVGATVSDVLLGYFPVMLQSSFCALSAAADVATTLQEQVGERRNDPGAYFIINGQEMMFPMSMKQRDDCCVGVGVGGGGVHSRGTYVALRRHALVVALPALFTTEIPLFIVMRALGIVRSDADIIAVCVCGGATDNEMFRASVYAAANVATQVHALAYLQNALSSSSSKSNISQVDMLRQLCRHLLPQQHGRMSKTMFLGYMVQCLLVAELKKNIMDGGGDADDDDGGDDDAADEDENVGMGAGAVGSIRVEMIGDFLEEEFMRGLRAQQTKYRQMLKTYLYLEKNEDLYRYNLDRLPFDKRLQVFDKTHVCCEHVCEQFLPRLQPLRRISIYDTIQQLRTICGYGGGGSTMELFGKVVCGENCTLALGAEISCHIDVKNTIKEHFSKEILFWTAADGGGDGGDFDIGIFTDAVRGTTKLFVNGVWIGCVYDPIAVVNRLKLLRRNGFLPPRDVSISFDIPKNAIHILSDGGRIVRPLFYVSNDGGGGGGGNISHRYWNGTSWSFAARGETVDMNSFLESEMNTWEKLTMGTMMQQGAGAVAAGITEAMLYRSRAVIEFVDAREENAALVCAHPDHLAMHHLPYTHLEVHPSIVEGYVEQICGGAMQICASSTELQYGQEPLVQSPVANWCRRGANWTPPPFGANVVVAIMSFGAGAGSGANSIVANKASVDRGLLQCILYGGGGAGAAGAGELVCRLDWAQHRDRLLCRGDSSGSAVDIIPEIDIPYMRNGLRPDIIISPLRGKSFQETVALLREGLAGKMGVQACARIDDDAFSCSIKLLCEWAGNILQKAGYHSLGQEVLMDGATGRQIESDIFVGLNYFGRALSLPHHNGGGGSGVHITENDVFAQIALGMDEMTTTATTCAGGADAHAHALRREMYFRNNVHMQVVTDQDIDQLQSLNYSTEFLSSSSSPSKETKQQPKRVGKPKKGKKGGKTNPPPIAAADAFSVPVKKAYEAPVAEIKPEKPSSTATAATKPIAPATAQPAQPAQPAPPVAVAATAPDDKKLIEKPMQIKPESTTIVLAQPTASSQSNDEILLRQPMIVGGSNGANAAATTSTVQFATAAAHSPLPQTTHLPVASGAKTGGGAAAAAAAAPAVNIHLTLNNGGAAGDAISPKAVANQILNSIHGGKASKNNTLSAATKTAPATATAATPAAAAAPIIADAKLLAAGGNNIKVVKKST